MRFPPSASLLISITLFLPAGAFAGEGECASGFCGTPDTDGGGGAPCTEGDCSGGGGCSILVNFTDMGETYSTSDDFDNDGFEDDFDNCPFTENRDQVDGDGDGVGTACDNAPARTNADQADVDGDGKGDVDDPDLDGDGSMNELDNCPKVPNPTQRATTAGIGDACNPDDDSDGMLDVEDPCPKVPGRIAAGGRACDDDEDLDGLLDGADNCPSIANADQGDKNGNGAGDACDPDLDGDGILNHRDNAPRDPNPDQRDEDRDGIGDVADPVFCYVYDAGHKDRCLNPMDTFKVAAVWLTEQREITTSGELRFILLANRKDAAIDYTWTVDKRPRGSDAMIRHPVGSVSGSGESFEYRAAIAELPALIPDQPGTYELKLVAKMNGDDPVFAGGPTVAMHTLTLTVAGEPRSEGCSTTGTGDGSFGLMILATAALLFRRRRRV